MRDGVGIQGVTDNGDDLAARFVRQCSGRVLQWSFGPGTDGDVAALERELAGNRPADAAAGAGNDGFLVGELQVHSCLLRTCTRNGYCASRFAFRLMSVMCHKTRQRERCASGGLEPCAVNTSRVPSEA